MSQELTEEHLRRQIESAFADMSYPGDDNLVISVEYIDNLRVELNFRRKHWRDITSETLFEHRFDLSRFTPLAFRFYLPAFLIASLQGELSGEIIQHVFWSLDPQAAEGKILKEFLAKVEALSSEQKTAVRAFIRYYVETETFQLPADKRIKEFWENH